MSSYYQDFIDHALRCAMIHMINAELSTLIIEYNNNAEYVNVWNIEMSWIDNCKLQIKASVNKEFDFKVIQITSVSFENCVFDAGLLALVGRDVRTWFTCIRDDRKKRINDAVNGGELCKD